MNYYVDQEFIEGFHKPWFGKRRHFIDLISIGIVCEDGREYQAISSEYDYSKASPWVVDNVIRPLYKETVPEDLKNSVDTEGATYFTLTNFHKTYGKPIRQIAREIFLFVNPQAQIIATKKGLQILPTIYPTYDIDAKPCDVTVPFQANPIFYGYYADYDWVLFCSLFGTMSELPKGFPMYMRDLQQMFDEKVESVGKQYLHDVNDVAGYLKGRPTYPKQENEHSALADARWNKLFHQFIKTI